MLPSEFPALSRRHAADGGQAGCPEEGPFNDGSAVSCPRSRGGDCGSRCRRIDPAPPAPPCAPPASPRRLKRRALQHAPPPRRGLRRPSPVTAWRLAGPGGQRTFARKSSRPPPRRASGAGGTRCGAVPKPGAICRSRGPPRNRPPHRLVSWHRRLRMASSAPAQLWRAKSGGHEGPASAARRPAREWPWTPQPEPPLPRRCGRCSPAPRPLSCAPPPPRPDAREDSPCRLLRQATAPPAGPPAPNASSRQPPPAPGAR
mmetsp:Transcript_83576/g.221743  ORF Transcript_83576/g.221743 Transcript_83576/m.221743 type:complete len:259 (-) Transcript_83576:330-1106(-)